MIIAMDRDETVDTSGGPIPIDLIRELKKNHTVVCIGNQKLCEEAGIEGFRGTKDQGLQNFLKKYPDKERYIVVNDVPISQPKWEYYSPERFLREKPWK